MRSGNAFGMSVAISVFIGLVVFILMPLAMDMTGLTKACTNGAEMAGIGMAMYIVYFIIQLILSLIFLVQIEVLEKTAAHTAPNRNSILLVFLLSEMMLYALVFGLFRLIVGAWATKYVLLFSIPYVICCTASVFIFRHYLIADNEHLSL